MAIAKTILATAAIGLIASTSGHMVITHPIPFDQASLNNSPLAADGSDFPCKFSAANGYTDTVTQMNSFQAGSTSNLTFMGSAVHGGGSCQVSYTTDASPTKSSQWKVLLSVIGGCPAAVDGNLAEDPTNTAGLNSFQFELPKDLPNGQGTIAWSWLNKIGNREFYMNCAPVTITGGAKDASGLASLPDMFVANLPPTTCAIPDSVNFVYPNPGKNVVTSESSALASTLQLSDGCASVTNMGAGAGKLGSPAAATDAPSAPAGASSADATSGAFAGSSQPTGNPGAVLAPGAASASPASPAPTTLATAITPPVPAVASSTSPESAIAPPVETAPTTPAPSPAAAPAGSGSAGSDSGSCPSGEVACSTPGFYCISATQFGMCANGCALPQAVAAGTSCTSAKIDFAVPQKAGAKSRRQARRDIHRHRLNSHALRV